MKNFFLILILLATFGIGHILYINQKHNTTQECNNIKQGDSIEVVNNILGKPDTIVKNTYYYQTQILETSSSTITINEKKEVISKHCLDGESF